MERDPLVFDSSISYTCSVFRSKPVPAEFAERVYVGFIERAYNLPPSDAPIHVSPSDAAQYHNTLCVIADAKNNAVRELVKKTAGLGTLLKLYNGATARLGYHMFVLQESADAPKASSFPPPANDDDPLLRPKYRTFNIDFTVKPGTIDKVLFELGGLQRCDTPMWVKPCGPSFVVDGSAPPPAQKGARAEAAVSKKKTTASAPDAVPSSSALPISGIELNFMSVVDGCDFANPDSHTLNDAWLHPLAELRDVVMHIYQKPDVKLYHKVVAAIRHNGYHTLAYRKAVYRMLAEEAPPEEVRRGSDVGALELFTAAAKKMNESAAELAEALPWNADGSIKPTS